MRDVDWYFDVISPFSYLALHRLHELPAEVTVRYHPVLFAGLLNHWGIKGPAEVEPKRQWTYRWCTWLAREWRIPFRFPSAHPFNPLPYLRLCVAAGSGPDTVRTVFDALWTTGADPADPAVLADLTRQLAVDHAALGTETVKQELRSNTQRAAERGVFGVPTLLVDGERFWGADAIPFATAFINDPGLLQDPEMRRVDNLPVGVSRTPR